MFEYLMPLLVMPNYQDTLLDETCHAAVRAQIEYGAAARRSVGDVRIGLQPRDVRLNYQYRAFGVPGLGFKRGLADDLVIAPYATALALMVAPREACENLERLAAEGMLGSLRLLRGGRLYPVTSAARQTSVTIRSFMAHHQGMSLLALAYRLLDRPMQRRFLSFRCSRPRICCCRSASPNHAKVLSEEYGLGKSRKLG